MIFDSDKKLLAMTLREQLARVACEGYFKADGFKTTGGEYERDSSCWNAAVDAVFDAVESQGYVIAKLEGKVS